MEVHECKQSYGLCREAVAAVRARMPFFFRLRASWYNDHVWMKSDKKKSEILHGVLNKAICKVFF
jgi:hypothetical protein